MDDPAPSRRMTWIRLILATGAVLLLVCGALLSRVNSFPDSPAHDTRLIMGQIEGNLAMYAAKHKGRFPEAAEDLQKVHRYFPNHTWPTDAWGGPITYRRTADGYTLTSLGEDGKPGGDGDDTDLIVSGPTWSGSHLPAATADTPPPDSPSVPDASAPW
jgi:general secretion pathway protein G